MILHLIQGSSTQAIQSCLAMAKPGDKLVFLGEGLQALDNEETSKRLNSKGKLIKLYVIYPTKLAKNKDASNAKLTLESISHGELVKLCAETSQIQSWN